MSSSLSPVSLSNAALSRVEVLGLQIEHTPVRSTLPRLRLPFLLGSHLQLGRLLLLRESLHTRFVSSVALGHAAGRRASGGSSIDLHTRLLRSLHLVLDVGTSALVPSRPSRGLRRDRTGPDSAGVEPQAAKFLVHRLYRLGSYAATWNASRVHRLVHALFLLHDGFFGSNLAQSVLLFVSQLMIVVHNILLLFLPFLLQLVLLSFQLLQLLLNVRIHEIRHVLTVKDLRHNVVLPIRIFEHIVLPLVVIVHTRAALSQFKVLFGGSRCLCDHAVGLSLAGFEHRLRDACASLFIVTRFRTLDGQAVHD
mmetsp:Transcript_31928/g.56066  ORF Transcript_31928/g.56066 Transcript_31928/m.56066 type:complete len:309 (+) Transcript_31928:186-1112(+)